MYFSFTSVVSFLGRMSRASLFTRYLPTTLFIDTDARTLPDFQGERYPVSFLHQRLVTDEMEKNVKTASLPFLLKKRLMKPSISLHYQSRKKKNIQPVEWRPLSFGQNLRVERVKGSLRLNRKIFTFSRCSGCSIEVSPALPGKRAWEEHDAMSGLRGANSRRESEPQILSENRKSQRAIRRRHESLLLTDILMDHADHDGKTGKTVVVDQCFTYGLICSVTSAFRIRAADVWKCMRTHRRVTFFI